MFLKKIILANSYVCSIEGSISSDSQMRRWLFDPAAKNAKNAKNNYADDMPAMIAIEFKIINNKANQHQMIAEENVLSELWVYAALPQ